MENKYEFFIAGRARNKENILKIKKIVENGIDLKIVGVFFKSLVTLIALSLIVIFQPELRRALEQLRN